MAFLVGAKTCSQSQVVSPERTAHPKGGIKTRKRHADVIHCVSPKASQVDWMKEKMRYKCFFAVSGRWRRGAEEKEHKLNLCLKTFPGIQNFGTCGKNWMMRKIGDTEVIENTSSHRGRGRSVIQHADGDLNNDSSRGLC